MFLEARTLSCLLFAAALSACGSGPPPSAATPSNGKIDVLMTSFAYEPHAFLFKTGEAVQFALTSKDMGHTFTAKDLGIDWTVRPGAPQRQPFTFAKAGTYKAICTVPGHEGAGMTGTITVT